jgi:peroxiredoxin
MDKESSYLPILTNCYMKSYQKSWLRWFFLLLIVGTITLTNANPVWADMNDDRPDGNIFVVYAGNGSLVPSKLTLAASLERQTPVILVYYLDDNSDSKQFAIVVSRLQEFYGRAATIIPVSVDSIVSKPAYNRDEVGYYYKGVIPQTVVLNQKGKIVYEGKGQVAYEAIDDVLRNVFDLLPRAESKGLKRRTFNEFNTELVDSF